MKEDMSAIGTKRTSIIALHMFAFEGKANMTFCEKSAIAVAIENKADIGCCTAYVRF